MITPLATSLNDILAILIYLIPIIVILAIAVVAVVYYYKKNKVSAANILAIASALLNNDYFKEIIDLSLDLTKQFYARSESYDIIDSVPGYLKVCISNYLTNILQETADSEVNKEINDIFNKYSVTINDIEAITSVVLELKGYTSDVIKDKIVDMATGEEDKK